jgi:hypothetical protein
LGEKMGIDFYELRDRKRSAEIKVSKVYRPDRVEVGGRVIGEVNGAEGASGLDQLCQRGQI